MTTEATRGGGGEVEGVGTGMQGSPWGIEAGEERKDYSREGGEKTWWQDYKIATLDLGPLVLFLCLHVNDVEGSVLMCSLKIYFEI
jgi:hypothetical protein